MSDAQPTPEEHAAEVEARIAYLMQGVTVTPIKADDMPELDIFQHGSIRYTVIPVSGQYDSDDETTADQVLQDLSDAMHRIARMNLVSALDPKAVSELATRVIRLNDGLTMILVFYFQSSPEHEQRYLQRINEQLQMELTVGQMKAQAMQDLEDHIRKAAGVIARPGPVVAPPGASPMSWKG